MDNLDQVFTDFLKSKGTISSDIHIIDVSGFQACGKKPQILSNSKIICCEKCMKNFTSLVGLKKHFKKHLKLH